VPTCIGVINLDDKLNLHVRYMSLYVRLSSVCRLSR